MRVRNMKRNTAWYGGSRALADFQVTPPFGSNMMGGTPGAPAELTEDAEQMPERPRSFEWDAGSEGG